MTTKEGGWAPKCVSLQGKEVLQRVFAHVAWTKSKANGGLHGRLGLDHRDVGWLAGRCKVRHGGPASAHLELVSAQQGHVGVNQVLHARMHAAMSGSQHAR